VIEFEFDGVGDGCGGVTEILRDRIGGRVTLMSVNSIDSGNTRSVK
jgi:hypothetical protein